MYQHCIVFIVFIFGLMAGSFLNVVIYRLPKMIERSWKMEALAFLREMHPDSLSESALVKEEESLTPFNLAYPASHCKKCGHAIRWYENIPVISWCLLRAKCSACGVNIPIRYPLVEILTGLTSAWIAHRYGWSIQTALCFVLNGFLIAAFWIDWDTQLLPDNLTMPLIWGGLIAAYLGDGLVPFSDSFLGAISGYGILWFVYWLFYLLFRKEGIGFGDFKLLSALGAWLGWSVLPAILLIGSLSGLIYGLIRAITGFKSPSEQQPLAENTAHSGAAENGYRWSRPLPFGPFLIIAGWIVWMCLPPQAMFFFMPIH